jgi:alkylated DNA nucleotide flippase Atl1
MQFCPLCRSELLRREIGERERLHCAAPGCGFVHWDNPVPVAAVIVEHGEDIILANNVSWPEHIYSVITGFVERGETPEQAAVREVAEELGITAGPPAFVGIYPFHTMNQLILAYHVHAEGEIVLGAELRAYKRINRSSLKPWRGATGTAVRDWLVSQGLHEPAPAQARPVQVTQRDGLYGRIDALIRLIPRGRVATYGQIARLVGGCGARQVGYALASLPDDSDVPWHRVINSQGRISARSGSDNHSLQRLLLESEGITFDDERVDLGRTGWDGPPARGV